MPLDNRHLTIEADQTPRRPQGGRLLRHLQGAAQDAGLALTGWRVWTTLAWNDIAQRYRRSMIGPLWITLSTAIFVGALGWLYAGLMHIAVHDYLPFIAVGYVMWLLISSFMLESGQSFVASEGYLKQVNMSKIGVVLRMVMRNFIIFLHNAIVIVAVMLIMRRPPGPQSWLILPSLVLILWFGVAMAVPLGMICTRFRDLNQMIVSLISVIFFITPIFWDPRTASRALVTVGKLNPFSAFLATFRDPLLGLPVHSQDWLIALGCCVAMSLFATVFFARFRSRIMYWL